MTGPRATTGDRTAQALNAWTRTQMHRAARGGVGTFCSSFCRSQWPSAAKKGAPYWNWGLGRKQEELGVREWRHWDSEGTPAPWQNGHSRTPWVKVTWREFPQDWVHAPLKKRQNACAYSSKGERKKAHYTAPRDTSLRHYTYRERGPKA